MNEDKKKNILSLIDKIDHYAHQPENEWLLTELQHRFCYGGMLDDIYEYCIENNIKEQAVGFYKDFPLQPIVPQLIQDFIKMEHFRRKNNFDEFSMSVYQQIEFIVNAICRNTRFDYVVNQLMGHPAFVCSQQNADGSWNSPSLNSRTGSCQIAQLLFGKEFAAEKANRLTHGYSVIDKIRIVLYFICYGTKIQSSSYNMFIAQKETLDELCHFSNRRHRDTMPSEWLKALYIKVDSQKGFYYMKFTQSLCSFVESVAIGLSSFDELYKYATEQSPITVSPSPKAENKQ